MVVMVKGVAMMMRRRRGGGQGGERDLKGTLP
jgi:hypothetical protein